MEKIALDHDGKPDDTVIEDVGPKVEQARIAAEEEHNLSVRDALSQNKLVVFWCIYFAFSGVAWYVDNRQHQMPAGDLTWKQGLRCSSQWCCKLTYVTHDW
jgi:hypothetical protein